MTNGSLPCYQKLTATRADLLDFLTEHYPGMERVDLESYAFETLSHMAGYDGPRYLAPKPIAEQL